MTTDPVKFCDGPFADGREPLRMMSMRCSLAHGVCFLPDVAGRTGPRLPAWRGSRAAPGGFATEASFDSPGGTRDDSACRRSGQLKREGPFAVQDEMPVS